MHKIYLILLLSFLFISKNSCAQDGIILFKTGKPIKQKLKIIKVTKDSIFYTSLTKVNKSKKLSLKEVRSYSIYNKKANKTIIHNVPLGSSTIKQRLHIPDPNAEYIRDHAKNSISYKKEEYSKGYIIKLNKDTLWCLIKGNEVKEMLNYLFVVAIEADSVLAIYEPKSIDSYFRDGQKFKSFHSNRDSLETYFFIKQIESGSAELYERQPIPSDNKLAYFTKLKGSDKYLYIAPEKKDIEINELDFTLYKESPTILSTYRSTQVEEDFKNSFSDLLKACPKLKYKILNETYKINDISTIIKEYNNCVK